MPYTDPIDRAHDSDLLEALADAIAIRSGLRLEDPHPLALRLSRDLKLSDLAARLGRLPPGAGPGELGRALNSSDFGQSLATALQRIVALSWGRTLGAWEAACLVLPGRGSKPVSTPTFELGELREAPKLGPSPLVPIDIDAGNSVTPRRYAFRFLIGRQMLINDEAELISAWVQHLTSQAAQLLPRLIGAALVANRNLADGQPLIGAANTTSDTGMDDSSLGAAFAKMRLMATDTGQISAATPRFLIVHPSLEVPARILVAALTPGAGTPPLEILVSAWHGPDSYLLADPAEAPTFAMVRPVGFEVPEVRSVPARLDSLTGDRPQVFDGQAFIHETWLGVGPVSRLGIVKIPAA